ncbi:MAG: high frequency lysogenization protein HflD [Pseudomonadota bacterium]
MTSPDNRTPRNRAIALAGLFQVAALVRQTGLGRMRDAAATQASLTSILKLDAASVSDVYGGIPALRVGLETLADQLGDERRLRDMELTGYAITLLHLERKLTRNADLQARLGSGLRRIAAQLPAAGAPDPETVGALAELYTQTISTLTPRILVHGDPGVLSGTSTRNMIRALLLAGIRAAVLWRQCGGSRLRLLFGRRHLREAAATLLREARLHGAL